MDRIVPVEDIPLIAKDTLNEEEIRFFLPWAVYAWFSMVPAGTRAPQVALSDLYAAIRRLMEGLLNAPEGVSLELLKKAKQPNLLLALAALLLAAMDGAKMKPRRETMPFMVVLLRVITDSLHDRLAQ